MTHGFLAVDSWELCKHTRKNLLSVCLSFYLCVCVCACVKIPGVGMSNALPFVDRRLSFVVLRCSRQQRVLQNTEYRVQSTE